MHKINYCFTLFLIVMLAAAIGCGKKQPPIQYSATHQDLISEYNAQVFANANLNSERSDYLLGPGDLLEIRILEAEKLNTTTRISSRGFISVPLLDEIRVGGMTAAEAEQFIEDKFKQTYIKDPHVSIFVKEHFSQRVTVVGQVRNPGTYDYPSRQRLLDAIALAGGLTEEASQTIQVRRKTNDTYQTLFINLDELILEEKVDLNVAIRGGDVIFVPEAGSFFVDGAVRKPGEYHIKQSLSIEEAIIKAGGYASYADTDEVLILRTSEEKGIREEIRISMDEYMQARAPVSIQNRDIIIVNASFWGKIFHGSGINLGLPGTGVSYRPVD